ncbi:MAG: hypothetical protein MJ175_10620, partial [Clostridia bacterium]|nr:hypothetical protein [Clostridia bacterium]
APSAEIRTASSAAISAPCSRGSAHPSPSQESAPALSGEKNNTAFLLLFGSPWGRNSFHGFLPFLHPEEGGQEPWLAKNIFITQIKAKLTNKNGTFLCNNIEKDELSY